MSTNYPKTQKILRKFQWKVGTVAKSTTALRVALHIARRQQLGGGSVSVVLASRAEGWSPGDLVLGYYGWQEYCIARPAEGRRRNVFCRRSPVRHARRTVRGSRLPHKAANHCNTHDTAQGPQHVRQERPDNCAREKLVNEKVKHHKSATPVTSCIMDLAHDYP